MTSGRKGSRREGPDSNVIGIKLHPDMREHVERQCADQYCTISEYIRRLVLADMRAKGSNLTASYQRDREA